MTFTDKQIAELEKPLDKKNVKPPAPGKYGEYVEGWHVIAEANRIFGFDGWTRETVCMTETNRDLNGDKWFVGYHAKVRVIVSQFVTREGSGFGSGVSKNLGDAIESAIKEAETDAMKRALMTFGNPFGLALYDKTKAMVADVVETITDGQRDQIAAIAEAAGVTLLTICERAGIKDLRELPADKYGSVLQKLHLTIEQNKSKAKEAA